MRFFASTSVTATVPARVAPGAPGQPAEARRLQYLSDRVGAATDIAAMLDTLVTALGLYIVKLRFEHTDPL